MKLLRVAFAVFALCALPGRTTPGGAAETEPAVEAPDATPLGPSMQTKRGGSGRGVLSCTDDDQNSPEIHTLICRFEDSESCVLSNATPLPALLRKYERVRFLMIGSTPEGCSSLTFTGTLKAN